MQLTKKIVLITASILLLAGLFLVLHSVYAANPVISLNSPVSFPVDI